MSLVDLLFLVCFAAAVITIGRIAYLALRGRFRVARTTLIRLVACIAAYMLVLIGVSLAEPRKEIPIGERRCFDDWCITVEQASRQKTIGAVTAAGTFCVVTLRVSSRAKGSRQRETDIDVYLIDDLGRRIEVSLSGQTALTQAGLAGEPLTSFVNPGASFQSCLAFDVPPDAHHLGLVKASHGWFPVRLIIGDAQSWLHKPTVTPLG
ncbi:MAG TPA: hypothetical protein VN380_20315 [Thermoanaerobaculia bacterium]|jgi:hypothetical protein|nr:hypothetical protein [Thermoanaerobaculia bacterium]